MTREKKQEFTLRITQANKTGLVVILYDMTLTFLEDAVMEFDKGNIMEYKRNIDGAKKCLDELLASLHLGYDISESLRGLYYFYKRELTSGAVQQKKEFLLPVIEMIKELKESYEKVASQDSSLPLMKNTQTVYAGLTYGKRSLNVNLADQGINRGFRV